MNVRTICPCMTWLSSTSIIINFQKTSNDMWWRGVFFLFRKGADQICWLANHWIEKPKALQDIKENIYHSVAECVQCIHIPHPTGICSVMKGGAIVDQHFNTFYMLRWSKRDASVCSYQLPYSSLLWKCDFFCHRPPSLKGEANSIFNSVHIISDMWAIEEKDKRNQRQKMRRKRDKIHYKMDDYFH